MYTIGECITYNLALGFARIKQTIVITQQLILSITMLSVTNYFSWVIYLISQSTNHYVIRNFMLIAYMYLIVVICEITSLALVSYEVKP